MEAKLGLHERLQDIGEVSAMRHLPRRAAYRERKQHERGVSSKAGGMEPAKFFKSRHEATSIWGLPYWVLSCCGPAVFDSVFILPSQTAMHIPCHSMLEVSDLLFSLQLRDRLQVSKEMWTLDFKLESSLESVKGYSNF